MMFVTCNLDPRTTLILKEKWERIWTCEQNDFVNFFASLKDLQTLLAHLHQTIRSSRNRFGSCLPATLLSVVGSFLWFKESAALFRVNKNWRKAASSRLFASLRCPALEKLDEIPCCCHIRDDGKRKRQCDFDTHKCTADGKLFLSKDLSRDVCSVHQFNPYGFRSIRPSLITLTHFRDTQLLAQFLNAGMLVHRQKDYESVEFLSPRGLVTRHEWDIVCNYEEVEFV